MYLKKHKPGNPGRGGVQPGAGGVKKKITSVQMKKIGGYARKGCQNGTIEALMDWSPGFIHESKDIRSFLTKKRAERKLFKRKELDGHAEKTPVVAIFQAKNELGMADKTETKHETGENLQEFIRWLKKRDDG